MNKEDKKLLENIKRDCETVIRTNTNGQDDYYYRKHLLLYRLLHGQTIEDAIEINGDEWFCPLSKTCRGFGPYVCDEVCHYSPKARNNG